jgi:hypothetical protein
MGYEIIDLKAAKWLIENGHTLSPELVMKLLNELEDHRDYWDRLSEKGCGHRECGMADSGFSEY